MCERYAGTYTIYIRVYILLFIKRQIDHVNFSHDKEPIDCYWLIPITQGLCVCLYNQKSLGSETTWFFIYFFIFVILKKRKKSFFFFLRKKKKSLIIIASPIPRCEINRYTLASAPCVCVIHDDASLWGKRLERALHFIIYMLRVLRGGGEGGSIDDISPLAFRVLLY